MTFAGGVLVLRRSAPLTVLAVTGAAMAGVVAVGGEPTGLIPGIALYTTAAMCELRVSLAALVPGAVIAAALSAATADTEGRQTSGPAGAAIAGWLAIGVWALGAFAQTRRRYTRALAQRAAQAEREREQLAKIAVHEERASIARELHDIVAHSVTMMLIGVRGARDVLHTTPVVADETLAHVETGGEQSLTELRRILALLRSRDDGAEMHPQPSIAELESLIADYRAAGLPVRLEVRGQQHPLPSGVELSVYRIIQEALTNVLKHSEPTRVIVTLCIPRLASGGRNRRRRRETDRAERCEDRSRHRRHAGARRAPRGRARDRTAGRRRLPRRGLDAGRRRRMTIRLLIVDDQELVRTGLRLFLETQEDLEVVGEAGDGAEAIERARQLRPDVVLMDIRMPGIDGVEATARLDRRRHPTTASSTRPDDVRPRRVRLRRACALERPGSSSRTPPASGCSTRSASSIAETPCSRRRSLAALSRTSPPAPTRSSRQRAVLEQLTPRERQVLVLVARGYSNDEIAQRLVITEATVKSHVGSILSKLNLRDRVHAVVFAYEHGIVVAGETS